MIESRRNSRRLVNKVIVQIFTNNTNEDMLLRKVINMSSGGMLLEKKQEDDKFLGVGKIFKFSIMFNEDYSILLNGKIIRKQDRSVAVIFVNLTEEQIKLLKAVCS